MSDRTWVDIYFPKKDRQAWIERIDEPDEEEEYGPNEIHFNYWEADYAFYSECRTMAERGHIFYGNHGESGDYGKGTFVGFNGSFFHVDANHDSDP